MWAGQGANLGDFYTIEGVRSAWCCRRSGLRGPKSLKLYWDSINNRVVLGGRYALVPESSLQNNKRLTWNRIPHQGELPKQVVWHRWQPKGVVTKDAKIESVATELVGELPGPSKHMYSRSFMLLVLERSAKKKEGDGRTGSKSGISVKNLSKVQFRCPSSTQGARNIPCRQGKQSYLKKSRQALCETTTRRDEDVRYNAPADIAWHAKQQQKQEDEESAEDVSANMRGGQLAEPMATNQKTFLEWDPCRLGAQSANKAPVDMLAMLLLHSQAPAEDVSFLRVGAPEFVPSSTKQLRSEAPEFLPSAALALSEAATLAMKAVGTKAQKY